MELDPQTQLQPNPNVEFSEATGKTMPNVADLRVSVMYSLAEEDGASEVRISALEASLARYVLQYVGRQKGGVITAAPDRSKPFWGRRYIPLAASVSGTHLPDHSCSSRD